MLNTQPQRPLTRIVAGLAGLAVLGFGLDALMRRNNMFYTNWWGGLVFAPMALIFGLFIIGCALFKPNWLSASRDANLRKHR